MNPFVLLFLAIASELVGTTSLKASEGFTRPLPSILVVLGYGLAFFIMSQILKQIPIGTAYAIWSGVGTAGTAIIGVLLFQETLTPASIIGIALIVVGVVVLQFFSPGGA